MLNVNDARLQAKIVWRATPDGDEQADEAYAYLIKFLDEVERLLHYNAIKQTPALFKVTK